MGRREDKKQKSIKKPSLNEGSTLGSPASAYAIKLDYPIFCFKHLVNGYTLNECNKEQKAHFVSKLVYMTQKTWQMLQFDDFKSGAGFEKMPREQIKTSLPSIITEDVGSLLSIRFNNMSHRIIGHRSGHIFHITHIDVNLTAYKH